MQGISKELVGASAQQIILSILKQGESYGYEIVQKIKELTGGEIKWQEASIYPVLRKLENQGMIKSAWKIDEGQRPRKYYTILGEGVKQLEGNKREWNLVNEIFVKLWSLETR